jgi:hypothetical protein
MSIIGLLIGLFPLTVIGCAVACALWMCFDPGPWPLVGMLCILYVVPVLAFRVHQSIWPMNIGKSLLVGRRYSPWWGVHQIQLVYIYFPALEAALRLVPGLYSAWLRLWGARVGRRVYWTPSVRITDRSLVEIGDDVVFGESTAMFSHIIRPIDGNLLLYVKPIQIGNRAFVGGYSVLLPGVRVVDGAFLRAWTRGLPNNELSSSALP